MTLPPRDTAPLLRPLLGELLALLRGLSADDWARPTVAGAWRVHDVAAHLLDGDLRKLSAYRDGHLVPPDGPIASERDLARFVNGMNAAGVAWGARVSPRLLTELLALAGGWVADLLESLPPEAPSLFPVSWAGESASAQWMDTAREYTERWHHQMQIRDAVGAGAVLLAPRWYGPLLDASVRALPHALAAVDAPREATAAFEVAGDDAWAWTLTRGDSGWALGAARHSALAARVRATPDAAWRVLYNAPYDPSAVRVEGDAALGAALLRTRSVIV
ncbi:maleylpyruvate isomerase N-terminal domain-containing protein [Roseisolibacter sp. H3M3-2]|uniref:maleylpyruvate isomerase N-terminal domain-containing protein n=1 Tax=Roseisolibacter sp. H3M3-2 TaxID=3031323 RepID=UPI0023D9D5E9|nr:maleylpyruvate isomerase N-terminal domain-containing protein [Roseisolibacter sp. H3M3-2]MDF1504441.1 maleylpyruvate isomerase N-terminal domain-containing protein [Roseisolibacter sp. H3M3-2]